MTTEILTVETKAAPRRVSSEDVHAALRERFSAPEWAILFEVANETGGTATRRADAIAMSLWPSRGLEIHGFEIKVDRRDWLRELKAPKKAEEIARYCDRWWIVAPPNVVKLAELPAGWGLLVFEDGTLRAVKAAPAQEAVPVTRRFLAALLRSASEQSPAETAVRAAVALARKEERANADVQVELARARAREDLVALQKVVDDFEAASGVRLSAYTNGTKIGEAVRVVLDGGFEPHRRRIERATNVLRDIVADCEKAIAIEPVVTIGDTPEAREDALRFSRSAG